jgi:hypothetical protein
LGPKYVLLANDTVEYADVTKDAVGYIFRIDGGIKARRTLEQVVLMKDNPRDLYLAKREKIDERDANEFFKLANWCHRYHMTAEAIECLKDAVNINPSYKAAATMLRLLDRPDGLSARTVAAEGVGPGGLATSDIPGGYGPEVWRAYTANVQYLLINKCGGCHNPRHVGDFHIVSKDRHPTVNMTKANFVSVEKCIDLKNPAGSRLLKMAITPHGGKSTQAPLGGPQTAQFRDLREWVFDMARNWREAFDEPVGFAAKSETNAPDKRPGPETAGGAKGKDSKLASKSTMKAPPGDRPGYGNAADDAPPSQPKTMPRGRKPAGAAADPFDPAQFNDSPGWGKSSPQSGSTKQSAGGDSPASIYDKYYKTSSDDGSKKNQ